MGGWLTVLLETLIHEFCLELIIESLWAFPVISQA